jgi:hypothetical protein
MVEIGDICAEWSSAGDDEIRHSTATIGTIVDIYFTIGSQNCPRLADIDLTGGVDTRIRHGVKRNAERILQITLRSRDYVQWSGYSVGIRGKTRNLI